MDECVAVEDADLAQRIAAVRLIAFDFDGVFTDNSVYVFQDGTEAVKCDRSDGIGLRKLEALEILPIIISTEPNPVVTVRSTKLRIRCIQGCTDKRAALDSLADELGISLSQVAFVGNDVNDLPCLTSVGVPIVVQNAHPDVIPYACYQTKTSGGLGAVREICDLFERVRTSAHL
jgi:3-deoxy-D-manno-octulosonate 8-phosphate phosphatase (KDO 8-P phosphatase)